MRHENCRAFEINRGPMPKRTGLTQKRKQQAEIELDVLLFLNSGGEIKELPSDGVKSTATPAFNVNPNELF